MVIAAKTVSHVCMHMGVSFAVMYAFTGSFALGGAAAVVEPICNVALMPLHDKAWDKILDKVAAHNLQTTMNRPSRAA